MFTESHVAGHGERVAIVADVDRMQRRIERRHLLRGTGAHEVRRQLERPGVHLGERRGGRVEDRMRQLLEREREPGTASLAALQAHRPPIEAEIVTRNCPVRSALMKLAGSAGEDGVAAVLVEAREIAKLGVGTIDVLGPRLDVRGELALGERALLALPR